MKEAALKRRARSAVRKTLAEEVAHADIDLDWITDLTVKVIWDVFSRDYDRVLWEVITDLEHRAEKAEAALAEELLRRSSH